MINDNNDNDNDNNNIINNTDSDKLIYNTKR